MQPAPRRVVDVPPVRAAIAGARSAAVESVVGYAHPSRAGRHQPARREARGVAPASVREPLGIATNALVRDVFAEHQAELLGNWFDALEARQSRELPTK